MKRDAFTLPLAFPCELIIDNFAGGGGTSTGLEKAFGRPVDIAINHNPEALAMHAINHPHTLHLCESVWTVNPIKVTRNQPVCLVWLSPDCKHFSKAKGGTPVAKHIRGLAWVGMRWVALCKPRVLMLENVEEFQTWGPLIIDADGNARPDPARKGKTFESFVRQLRAHGYVVDWRELRACDQGTPTIRKRLFLIARRDGLPICWPEQTHGEPTTSAVLAGKLAPYRTAAECIDFTIEGTSIFGRKKDLATNTLRRVAKGLWRHVLTSPKPFIVGVGGRMGQSPERTVHAPLQTITSKADSCVAQPVLVSLADGRCSPSCADNCSCPLCGRAAPRCENGNRVPEPDGIDNRGRDLRVPGAPGCGTCIPEKSRIPRNDLRTAGLDSGTDHCGDAGGIPRLPADRAGVSSSLDGQAAAEPFLVNTRNGERPGQQPRVRGVDDPYWTITGLGSQGALAQPMLAPFLNEHANASNQRTMAADEPLRTVCAQVKGGHFSVVAGHITKFNTGSVGTALDDPLSTVTAGGTPKRPSTGITQGLVAAHLVDMGHGEGKDGTKRFSHGVRSIEVPLNTVTASGATSGLAAVHLTHLTHHGERSGHSAGTPLPTVTGAHRGEQALVAACLEQANGGFYDGDGRAANAPMSTITAAGSNQRLIAAYAVKYYSSGGQWQELGQPMHTLPTKDRMGLVQVMQVPADCLAPELRERARQCAELLHTHLPEHFPEPAEMVLVWHAGLWWVLVDITLRMLKPRELFNAQGFPADYVIHEIPDPALLFGPDGHQVANPLDVPRIPLSATAQVRMCGNSVCPPQAEALVRANFGHEALIYGVAAA